MLLSIGMMVCDTLIRTVPDDILKKDMAEIERPVSAMGGDALNVSQAASRLGQDVTIVGRVGNDLSGRFIFDKCRELGINTDHVITSEASATACSYALIDQDGERHFLSDIAIFDELCAADVSDELIGSADVVFIGSACSFKQMDNGGIEDVFSRAKRLGKLTAMDAATNPRSTSDNWLDTLRGALQYTDYFFPSYEEAVKITGKTEICDIESAFRGFGLKGFGIKLGSRGSFVTDFHEGRIIGSRKVEVVDTTGAGDTFMGAFLTGIIKGLDMFESAGFASSVAAESIRHVGAAAGIKDYEQEYQIYKGFSKQL